MKQIILYGELAKRFGKHHNFAVKNVSEAIRALSANCKGFHKMMAEAHRYGIGFSVKVGKLALNTESDAANPCGELDVIRIAPALFGSSGVARILVGAVLVVGGILISGASFGAAGQIGGSMIYAGIGLIIGGVASLLTGPPKIDLPGKETQSYIFNGATNTTTQGGIVPVGYGRMIVGSIVISAGIETHEIA